MFISDFAFTLQPSRYWDLNRIRDPFQIVVGIRVICHHLPREFLNLASEPRSIDELGQLHFSKAARRSLFYKRLLFR